MNCIVGIYWKGKKLLRFLDKYFLFEKIDIALNFLVKNPTEIIWRFQRYITKKYIVIRMGAME